MRRYLTSLFFLLLFACSAMAQQDWIRTGTGLGVEKIRVSAPDFAAASTETQTAELLTAFNSTLWNDLEQAGIFEMVSKSFYPLGRFGSPADVRLEAWGNPPPNASMLAFGNLGVGGGQVAVQGWLYDVKNAQSPQVLGKQYRESASADNARAIAHRFANEIIFRLGGGIQGITESKIFFVSARAGSKEVWSMDYDGANQHAVTRMGSISLSPRISPDNSRLAFSSFARGGPNVMMWSMELGRLVSFPSFGGTNLSPAWSPDGTRLAFSSSRSGDPEIYTVDANGSGLKRITAYKGPDVSPVWNPKTGSQIAFVSGRTGLPQIYVMDSDGTNLQRLTDEGYAVSPSWSPNGQFLAFAWIRHYGPGAPGAQDIYIMDVASRQWVQLTHDGGRNDFPSWSPDGRHLVFQSDRAGGDQIWTMLADGSQQKRLTSDGKNSQPNWSFK
ncbi:MAG TPA: Tol-Pal system beta propeller repeat protein TolB [Clostridia bacterium]|nr:Tol-Pal system beta propeller repeat protein TolB [Clostridia bacterium]